MKIIWLASCLGIFFLCLGCIQVAPDSRAALQQIFLVNQQATPIPLAVEIANTPEKRSQGLMFRTALPTDQGMLFVFDTPDYYSFWMKNTYLPLEMIFINEQATITDIIQASPCQKDPCPSYKPTQKALYVLEVNAGYTNTQGLVVGNTVILGDFL